MNIFEATMLAEGVDEPEGDTEAQREASLTEAWQMLIDTGTAWKLQGWFGRIADSLIERGVCTPPGCSDAKEG